MQRERTDWTGVAFGITFACLVAFQQFKLPPVLPGMIVAYGWDRTLAGGFMAVYALAGLAFSIPIGRAMQRRGILGLLFAALGFFIIGNFLTLGFPSSGAGRAAGPRAGGYRLRHRRHRRPGAGQPQRHAPRPGIRHGADGRLDSHRAIVRHGPGPAAGELADALARRRRRHRAAGTLGPGAPPPRCLRHARRDRARAGTHEPAPALRAPRGRLDLPALVDAIFRLYDLAPPISGRGHGPGQYGGDGGLCAAGNGAARIQHTDGIPAGRRRAAGRTCC